MPLHFQLKFTFNGPGSHLVDRLMIAGHHVIVVDNMFTGRQKNVAQWIGHPHFQLIIHDVVGIKSIFLRMKILNCQYSF